MRQSNKSNNNLNTISTKVEQEINEFHKDSLHQQDIPFLEFKSKTSTVNQQANGFQSHLFLSNSDVNDSDETTVFNQNSKNHLASSRNKSNSHAITKITKMDFEEGYYSGTCYEQTTTNTTATKHSLTKVIKFIIDHATMVALLIMSCVIIILMILSSMCFAQHYQHNKICLTQDCIHEAVKIIRSIDELVEPCEDFYQFVCGQWLEATIIPEHKPMENKFDELHDILNRQVRTILEEPLSKEKDPDFVQNMKRFYHSCMNVSEIDRKGVRPLIEIIEKLGGWPVLQEPNTWNNEEEWSLINIHNQLNNLGVIDDMLISLIITSYDKNNSRNIMAIKEPSFGLMNREFMIKDNNDTAIRSYFSLMLYSLQLLLEQQQQFENDHNLHHKNITSDQMESMKNKPNHRSRISPREFTFEMDDIHLDSRRIEEMRQVLEFEQLLANNSIKKEERTNVSQLFNNMTIEQLQKISPNVDWIQLINLFTPEDHKLTKDSEIVVVDLNYVKFLSKILPETNKRLLANYIVWRVIKSKIGVLDSTWRRLKQTYNSINLGHPKIEPRWMQCVSHTHATLGTALSNVYVKNYFSIKEKNKIDEIVWQIRAELNETISKAGWMDSETRKNALDKLNLMNFRIGFPDEILDNEMISKFYENLTLTDDYFNNVIAINKFEVENAFKSLEEINSRDDWRKYSEVVDVNAYYFHQENAFILNAGILQDRFFNPNRPNYLNYGSIGEIIGHEITHGFDSIGKQFDKTGQLKNWWKPITNQMYEERASCMVNQYNQYYFKQIDRHLNGLHTKDENIADNLGVTLAYRAYTRAYSSSDPEQYLPGLHYNPRQLFWISYGLANCEKMTDEMLKLTLEVDTHAPGKFRLNGVVSNSKYFAEDFFCPLDSPMNPKIKCQVW